MMNSTGSPGSTGQSPDKLPLVTPGRKLVPRRLHSTPDYTKINLGTLSQDCLNDLDDDDKQRFENLKASVGEDWKQVSLSTGNRFLYLACITSVHTIPVLHT